MMYTSVLDAIDSYEAIFHHLEQQWRSLMSNEGFERKELTLLSGLYYEAYCKDPCRVLQGQIKRHCHRNFTTDKCEAA